MLNYAAEVRTFTVQYSTVQYSDCAGDGVEPRHAPDPGQAQARHQVQAEVLRGAPQRAADARQHLVRGRARL